jgi:tetratricopeptide (TPR) repeat protein
LITRSKYDQARQLLKVAQAQEGDNTWVYYYWGRLEASLNHDTEAVTAYRKALTLDGENAMACYALALAYARLSAPGEALQASLQYLKLDPNGTHSEEMKRVVAAATLSHTGVRATSFTK